MNVMLSANGIAPQYIRNAVILNGAFAAAFGAGTLLLGGLMVRAIVLDRFDRISGGMWFGLLVFAGMTLWTCRDALDRRVVVTLDGEGFRDRRTGSGLTPWSAVRRAAKEVRQGATRVVFEIGPADARDVGSDCLSGSGRSESFWSGHVSVRIDVTKLDASGDAILAYVRRAAPHVEISDQVRHLL